MRIRFMNEGMMIHPMHLHGMHMTVIDKDGWSQCDRQLHQPRHLGVPLPHPPPRRGPMGMFGMVTALAVEKASA